MNLSSRLTQPFSKMYIDDLTDAIAHCAEAQGWNVDGKTYYREQSTEFEFSKFSPAGRDFSFSVTLKNADFSAFINELEDFYEGYDVDYETYIWLDDEGHGKNGAPTDFEMCLKIWKQ